MHCHYADFPSFYCATAGFDGGPHPYQVKLASKRIQGCVIHVLTFCGETAAGILTWLRQWHKDPGTTPCLVMNSLPTRVHSKRAHPWSGRPIRGE
jgi:hypothetical protein